MQKFFLKNVLLTLFLCCVGNISAQTIVGHIVAETPVNFANENFSAGTLTVTLTLPANTASAEITFPTGIEYVAGSLAKASGAATVDYVAGSPAGKPKFTFTGASGGITFTIKRKVTKAALATLNASSVTLKDRISVTSGSATDAKDSNDYSLPLPKVVVQFSPEGDKTHNNAMGTSNKTFVLRNSGEGKVKDIYFSVKYPTGITGNSIRYNGAVLSPVGTVPSGVGNNTGEKLYRVTSTNGGFGKNDEITITENYTVTGCDSNRNIKYEAYWGESITQLYEMRDHARVINVLNGTPKIEMNTNNTESYFQWVDGVCGNKLGIFTVKFTNTGSGNGTAYDLSMLLQSYLSSQKFKFHRPTNFRLVATDNTEVPISSMTPDNTTIVDRNIDFNNLPELSNATLGTKDIGLTDVDGDGFRDDLATNAQLTIRFDMVKNEPLVCLKDAGGQFAISPQVQFFYKDACGASLKSDAFAISATHQSS